MQLAPVICASGNQDCRPFGLQEVPACHALKIDYAHSFRRSRSGIPVRISPTLVLAKVNDSTPT